MNKIIILGDGSNIIGEFVGVWCKGEWEKIDEEVMKPKGRGALKLNDIIQVHINLHH
jgi:hypothetical protein